MHNNIHGQLEVCARPAPAFFGAPVPNPLPILLLPHGALPLAKVRVTISFGVDNYRVAKFRTHFLVAFVSFAEQDFQLKCEGVSAAVLHRSSMPVNHVGKNQGSQTCSVAACSFFFSCIMVPTDLCWRSGRGKQDM